MGVESKATRVSSLDALRGLVMIIMALDHVRDFVHNSAMSFPPEDLARTTPILFFTRWITHFCAPTFTVLKNRGGAVAILYLAGSASSCTIGTSAP